MECKLSKEVLPFFYKLGSETVYNNEIYRISISRKAGPIQICLYVKTIKKIQLAHEKAYLKTSGRWRQPVYLHTVCFFDDRRKIDDKNHIYVCSILLTAVFIINPYKDRKKTPRLYSTSVMLQKKERALVASSKTGKLSCYKVLFMKL